MTRKSNTLAETSEALEARLTTSQNLIENSLRHASDQAALNAFVAIDSDTALAQANASDERRKAGKQLSAIDGIPIAVKDNYLTKDYPTTACSAAKPLESQDLDATVVRNLRNAGAVIFAKTNMHEWAFGATNSTSSIGATRNPHNLNHITGGSSGGSGAAVASGIVTAALGSDTGGSVRIPAAACGVYGFKPSYGRASRYGVLPLSWSLDAPGPLTRSLDDLPLLLPYFFGPDPRDSSTLHARPYTKVDPVERPSVVNLIGAGLERSDEVNSAIVAALKDSDALVSDSTLENVPQYFAAWEAILHCEASSYHAALMTKQADLYSSVTRAHLEAGKQLTAVELLKAQKIRVALRSILVRCLRSNDALVLPTLPVVAPKHDVNWQEFQGRRVTTQDSMTWFCWIGNLAGLPCLSVPIGSSNEGLPIGMMLMGHPNQDEKLIEVAKSMVGRLKTEVLEL